MKKRRAETTTVNAPGTAVSRPRRVKPSVIVDIEDLESELESVQSSSSSSSSSLSLKVNTNGPVQPASTTTSTKAGSKRMKTQKAQDGANDKANADDKFNVSTASTFRKQMLEWYDANRRDLPWRGAHPYGVWVSEIMCQQTKVDTVIPYYNRWLEEFPTVEALAKASIDDVNRVWAGLGYYRRAKFLHEGGIKAWETFRGELPASKKELMTIKGIGDYTSSAIASICFNHRDAAVDGNVIRVFSRLRAVPLEAKDKLLHKRAVVFAQDVIKDCDRPGDFNQSMMELGAMVCTPRKPKCPTCPVRSMCKAIAEKDSTPETISESYPSRPSGEKVPMPEKHVYVAVVTRSDEEILAVRRPNDGGLLSNQWELVCVEKDSKSDISSEDIKLRLRGLGACQHCLSLVHTQNEATFKHVFSHLKHHVTPFKYQFSLQCPSPCITQRPSDDAVKWIPMKDLRRAGLTRSMTKALEVCGLLLK